MVKRLGWVLLAIAAVYGAWVLFLFVLQRRVLFASHYTTPLDRAGEGIRGLEKIWLETDEGRVEAWFLRGEGVSEESPGPAVLFAHGNAELIEYWPAQLKRYRELGVSLVLGEYRGYGRSAGSPSQRAITADFVALYDLVAARPDVDAERIFFHGRSVGAGVTCALAARRKPAALIVESTFTSVADMAKSFWVPGFLVRDRFDNRAVLSTLDAPVLIIHGRADEVIPFAHSEKLAAAARNATHVVYECGHNDLPPNEAQYWKDIEAFLQDAGLLTGD